MRNIIFGASTLGEKFIFYHFDEIEIECFFDNYRSGQLGKYEILKPYYQEDFFIIVATNRYLEVRNQLIKIGYREFENFIPYQLYKKRMVVMHGNCHMFVIRQYLESNADFCKEYGFYPFPMIQEMPKEFIYKDILYHCDLFLHQSIRKGNCYGEEYSSEALLRNISEKCRVISLPNLYGLPKCFFPQLDMSRRKTDPSDFQYTIGRDKNVAKWIEENISLEEIKNNIKNVGGVYNKKEILMMWKEFKKKIESREKEWDIKISDFIFQNYRKKKLFYDPNHIGDLVAREIAIRLLVFLGYDKKIKDTGLSLDMWDTYIYKDVVDALELQFDQEYLRKGKSDTLADKDMIDSEGYIEDLYRWEVFYKRYIEV